VSQRQNTVQWQPRRSDRGHDLRRAQRGRGGRGKRAAHAAV